MLLSELNGLRFYVGIPLQRNITQIMKAIVIFIFFILIGTTTMAQDTQEVKVNTFSAGVELNIKTEKNDVSSKEVARLYMFKNSRVKKALKFKTKRNSSKIA